jgi:hypothetical protein
MDFPRLAISAVVGTLMMGAAAFADAPLPNYSVTPLTQADVNFYLDIMRAAAQHNSHLMGDDKAAADYMINQHAHPYKPPAPGQIPSQAQMAELMRNGQLAQRALLLIVYDLEIAKERNVSARYAAVKTEMEQAYAMQTMIGDKASAMTLALSLQGKPQVAALMADKALVAPHVAEITALKKQINGFMLGRGL